MANPVNDPFQKGVSKALSQAGEQQTNEALQQGVPPQFISQQSGISQSPPQTPGGFNQRGVFSPEELTQSLLGLIQNQGIQQQPGMQLSGQFKQPSSPFSGAKITPEGDVQRAGFFNVFGLGEKALLDDLSKLADIQKTSRGDITPFKLLETFSEFSREQRLEGGEKRRTNELKGNQLRQFGGRVNSNNLQDIKNDTGIDISATIEAFGIEPKVNSRTGDREYVIPPDSVLKQRASVMPVTSQEQEYFNTQLEVLNRTNEVFSILTEMGISPEQYDELGDMTFEEVQTNLGPMSIPARFKLARQFSGDKNLVRLANKLERLFQSYRKAVTGAQASAKELDILRPLFPAATDRPSVLFANLVDLQDEFKTNMSTRLDLMESVGRNVGDLRQFVTGFGEKAPSNEVGFEAPPQETSQPQQKPTSRQSPKTGTALGIKFRIRE